MKLLTFLSVLVLSLSGYANSSDGGSGKTCSPGSDCASGNYIPDLGFPTDDFSLTKAMATPESLRFLDYNENSNQVIYEVIDKTGAVSLVKSEMQQLVDLNANLADAIFDSYENGSNWVDIRQL